MVAPGADALSGGTGNDLYVVDEVGDSVTENASAGTDTVHSTITYTLGANLERLSLLGTAVDQWHGEHPRQCAHWQQRQ